MDAETAQYIQDMVKLAEMRSMRFTIKMVVWASSQLTAEDITPEQLMAYMHAAYDDGVEYLDEAIQELENRLERDTQVAALRKIQDDFFKSMLNSRL